MTALAIALETGFHDDHVMVIVEKKVVMDEEHLSTRYQLGLARMFQVPVNSGEARVEVRLPKHGIAGETVVDVARSRNLRISIESGVVYFTASDRPLFYA